MRRLTIILALFVVGMVTAGCSTSLCSSRRSLLLTGRTSSVERLPEIEHLSTTKETEQKKLQEVMQELSRLGETDPTAQEKLLDELRASDPSLWPLVVEQFKATMAYRRQMAEKNRSTVQVPERLPAITETPTVVSATPSTSQNNPEVVQSASNTSSLPEPAQVVRPEVVSTSSEQVVPVSYTQPVPVDWRQQLERAIEALEAETPKNATTQADVVKHARLRLLYAAAGRQEDATRPIPDVAPETQEFLTKELDGLITWLNVEQMADTTGRAAAAKPLLLDAVTKLSQMAPLVVRNLAFCTEVQSYGCVKKFDRYQFKPEQEVLLYAEIDNFTAKDTPKGYHTSLQSKYEIIDAAGNRVADYSFAPTEEFCQNLRRDYFIGYHLKMPKDINPGKYSLRLSIEDLLGHKCGQASIDFEILSANLEKKVNAQP